MNTAYKKIQKQISFTALYKIVMLVLNFLLIALLLDYLGQEHFGIYIALTSLFSWMFMFDLGIAKGMRNFVTLAISNTNLKEAGEYVSTAYIAILILTLAVGAIIISALPLLDLQAFFNIDMENRVLQNIFFVLILAFFLKFYFSTVDQLNYATHQSQNVALNGLLVAGCNLAGIGLLRKLDHTGTLIYAIAVFSLSIVLPYLYATFRFFYKRKALIPSISNFSRNALGDVFDKGLKILFIQIGFLLIIGIDRLILLKYGNAVEVTKYEIIYKVMSIVIVPVSIVLAPLWSAFTDAYARNDLVWIKSVFNKFYLMMVGLLAAVIVLAFLFNTITSVWLTSFPYVEFFVILMMGILILELVWSTFHTDFLLGIHRLSYIIGMVALGLLFKFGFLYFMLTSEGVLTISAVIISSVLAYCLYDISVPFYIKRLLLQKEQGE